MIVLGLDPGTARLGWGVIDTGETHRPDQAVCLAYGCIETDKSMSDAKRLVAIANGVEQLLNTYKPAVTVVEKLFFSNNQTTAMVVSQARGVLLYLLAREGYAYLELTPQAIKQGLTGYGRADKGQMQRMVQLILKLSTLPKPDDAADALASALTAAQMVRRDGGLTTEPPRSQP